MESRKEFINKDFIKPLQHSNDIYDKFKQTKKIESERWAVNTAAKCKNPELVPKFQQYETYNFPRPSNEEVKTWQVASMATDNITLKFDPKNKKGPDEPRFADLKSKFGSHTETFKQGWVPNYTDKTINNRSSVRYNIINPIEPNVLGGAIVGGILDRKLYNVKKGVAEISDLTRVTNPNYNKNYSNLFHENLGIFRGVKGIFTDMYDMSHKNGNISMPFRRGADANENDANKPKVLKHTLKRYTSVDLGNFPKSTRGSGNTIQLDTFNSKSINIMPNTTKSVVNE